MASKTVVTFAGRTILASAPIEWSYTEGVRPYVTTLDFMPDDAKQLLKTDRGGPYDLVITSDDVARTIKNLWMLRRVPGEHKYIVRIEIADRRWMWPYAHVVGRYNVRRKDGVKRVATPDTPPEVADIVPDIHYAPYSLKPPQSGWKDRWKPRDVLEDVWKKATSREFDPPGYRITGNFGQSLEELTIEDLQIEDSGDSAIAKALSYLPEAGIYIDDNGVAVIYSKVDGGEVGICQPSASGPEMVGRGHIEMVSNKWTCPKKVHVRFVREQEVRFDAIEKSKAIGSTSTKLTTERLMENVLPVPDYQLGRWCQGTYVTFDEYLNALPAPPGGVIPRLDHSHLQRAFLPYLDLWGAIQLLGVRDPNSDWVARVAALQQHYRRTYRINPTWRDRFLRFYAYRVATIDPTTGTRAPSLAYADYAYLGSQKYWWKQLGENGGLGAGDLAYAINVDGYPKGADIGNGAKAFDANSKAAPIRVQILDHDQGIIHFVYELDPVKMFDTILPSNLENIPSGNVNDRTRSVSFNAVIKGREQQPPKLSASHKVAVVLMATPASPNNSQQFFEIVLEPKDVQHLLPSAMRESIKDARGPEMDYFVGPGIETARGAWVDSRRDDIDKLFGIKNFQPAPGEPAPDNGLIINDNQSKDGSASLRAIALARAAGVYALHAAHLSGSAEFRLSKDITIAGWISRVTHTVETDGVASTRVDLPDQLQGIDMFAFLDASTRALIMKMVQGGQ
jgi:hypothetical protein